MTDNDVNSIPHPRGGQRNLQIQWLRATAAVMVMLFHATVYQSTSTFSIFDGRFGIFAVALFFAISGYLMAVAIQRQNAFLFLAHRVIRIYPIFLIVAALYYITTRLLHMPVPVDLSALSLVPVDSADYPLTVEWTLVFEVSFYIALFVVGLLGLGKYIFWVALTWFFYLAVFSWHEDENKYLLTTILKAAEDVPMAGGLLIPWLARVRLPPAFLIALGVGLFFPFYYLVGDNPAAYHWLAGIAAVLVVMGIVRLSQNNPAFGDNRAGQIFARLGDYSYALYLVHAPVLRFLSHIGVAIDLVWLGSIASAITLAIILGKLDLYLYGHLKTIVNKARPRWRRIAVTGFAVVYFWMAGVVVYAWYAAQHMQIFAADIKPRLMLVTTPEAAAEAAGLVKANKLRAIVDRIGWQNGSLTVEGWAIDLSHDQRPVGLAFYQDGRLLGVSAASINRPDINSHYHTHMLSSYKFTAAIACHAADPITILAFTRTKFALSENNQPPLVCPP